MVSQSTPLIRARVALMVLAATGCGRADSPPVVHVVTQSSLDSLPRLSALDGRRLCRADGWSACPLHTAVGNWLSDGRFAIWEPGRPVMIWMAGDTVAIQLVATDTVLHATAVAVAVAPDGSGYRVVTADPSDRLLHFRSDGHLVKSEPLPPMEGVVDRGFSGDLPLLLRLRETSPGQTVQFQLDALTSPGDTIGRPLMRVPMPTVKLVHEALESVPFFTPWPSFGLDPKGNIVWTAGDRFVLHGADASGAERWTLTGGFPGPRVTDADIAARRRDAGAAGSPEVLTSEQMDSMAAHAAEYLAAIGGITVSRKGEILISGPVSPARDSVDFYRVTADGRLRDRFRLPRESRVVLFAGDSLLVHRPTEGEPWEIRWLSLAPAR